MKVLNKKNENNSHVILIWSGALTRVTLKQCHHALFFCFNQ